MKCEYFCDAHCSFDCPNFEIDAFEERYDLPVSDAGYERIKCKECRYSDKNCECDNCYFQNSKDCPSQEGE